MPLTQARLLEVLSYNSETGLFTRRITRKKWKAGELAGGYSDDGYVVIRVDGTLHRAHHLVWLYMFGCFPAHEIDHINGIRDDNRLENLRDVQRKTNCKNSFMRRDNTSGTTGITYEVGKYRARITVNGKCVHLGRFTTKEDAESSLIAAREANGYTHRHGSINNANRS